MTPDQAIAAKPELLYLSPVVPLLSGNGLAMRAGMVLQVLARHYRISLLIVRLYAPYDTPIPEQIAALCYRIADQPAPSTSSPTEPSLLTRFKGMLRRGGSRVEPATNITPGVFQGIRFDILHLFRLSMLPFAQPYLDAPRRQLDLDDVESIAHRRLAELYRLNGNSARARFEELAVERAEASEASVLRDFDRVYVCSENDRTILHRQSRAQVCVLPNALPIPGLLPSRDKDTPFTYLFVGTLGYYPNEDAIVHFCTATLPLIRQAARRPLQVLIVGTGATNAIHQLAELPDVQLIGAVADVAPWYAAADVVIVPIRAGGGTRIKVLEAFSYRRPVVSTSLGIEGIAACHEEHVLLGDTPSAFAEQCLRLMDDPQLVEHVVTNAHALFLDTYTVEAVARHFETCL